MGRRAGQDRSQRPLRVAARVLAEHDPLYPEIRECRPELQGTRIVFSPYSRITTFDGIGIRPRVQSGGHQDYERLAKHSNSIIKLSVPKRRHIGFPATTARTRHWWTGRSLTALASGVCSRTAIPWYRFDSPGPSVGIFNHLAIALCKARARPTSVRRGSSQPQRRETRTKTRKGQSREVLDTRSRRERENRNAISPHGRNSGGFVRSGSSIATCSDRLLLMLSVRARVKPKYAIVAIYAKNRNASRLFACK
jgi:hypothetical protein